MSTFSQLKKSSSTQFDKLNQELSKLNQKPQFQNDSTDERFWKPSVDKVGNGSAIIRFLPAPDGEDVPFVRVWDHGFQGPGGWYIEKSLTTLNQKDPLSEYNAALWATGLESNKDLVRKQKRRLHFYSNIYVVKDPANPANDGKVFLYKYGKKIFDKLNDLMHPEFEDEKPINPFDLWTGANMRLKIRQVEGFRNYDKSEFEDAGPLLKDDAELEKIWKSEHGLSEFIDPKNFKTYEELKIRFDRVLQLKTTSIGVPVDDDMPAVSPRAQKEVAPAMAEGDDEGMDYFRKLAAEQDD